MNLQDCPKMLSDRAYQAFPYSWRKNIFALLHPRKFRRYQFLRTGISRGYTYRSFLELQCLFIHIPKAAGISVCTSLFSHLGGGHNRLKDYQMIFTEKEFETLFKFAFVRNPWDKIFSAYHFLLQGGYKGYNREWAKKHLSAYRDFNDFICNGLHRNDIRHCIHFRPQYEFVCLPLESRPHLDYVGFFEHLTQDFVYISNCIYGRTIPLEHKNKTTATNHVPFQEAYSEASRRIVGDLYGQDIEMFGYQPMQALTEQQLRKRELDYTPRR
ncbi:sulfotransferase family 2 domain-containing protein [Desulfofustis limnaeus]|nr:sulfotransferase family 2 domain-containing protein [Desulfofustis limnaeus]